MKRECPNCKKIYEINEHTSHCSNCGFIFIDMIKRMTEEKTNERSTVRRTGNGVDQLDG